jgi:hypothetical protein
VIFGTIRRWWWRRQRAIDLQILWPICKEKARSLDHARAAFAVHAFTDPAWVGEYGERIVDVIGELQ